MKLYRNGLIGFVVLLLGTAVFADELVERGFVVGFDGVDREVAQETLGYLLEAEAEFAPHLPLGETPVRVRIASSMNEFLGLSGTYAHVGVSGVTRAQESLIALKSPRLRSLGEDYRGTVRHELVHILLHRNTNTNHLPRWLNEGMCMMLANELRWGSVLEVARMNLSGQVIPLNALDRTFVLPGNDHQFGNAYAQALSMTRHLRDEVGDEAFWALIVELRTAAFPEALQRATGLTPQDFWQSYRGSLWGLTVISVFRTGSFWGAISLLCILAFLVRHWRNRAIIQRWAEEEAEDDDDERPFDWDSILADEEEWKNEI